MLKLLKCSGWLILLLVAVGCATMVAPDVARTPVPSSASSPSPSPLTSPLTSPLSTSDVLLQYHRSGGVAGVDETWIVHANGQVDYRGRGSSTSKQLTPDQIGLLSGMLRSGDVLNLKDAYIPQNTCCDRFTYEFTIMIDGQSRTIKTMDAAPDEPAALANLRDTLDNMLK